MFPSSITAPNEGAASSDASTNCPPARYDPSKNRTPMTPTLKSTPATPAKEVKLRAERDLRKHRGATTRPLTPRMAVERLARKP